MDVYLVPTIVHIFVEINNSLETPEPSMNRYPHLALRLSKGKGDKRIRGKGNKNIKTYNTGDSLVVTDPTTDPAVASLSMGERTGSRVF